MELCISFPVCLILKVEILCIDNDELVDAPILVRMVGQIPSNDDWDFALFQFFHGNLQWIRFALQLNHNRCTHGDLQCPRAQHSGPFVFGHVSSGDAFLFRHTAARLSWCDDFKVFGLFVLIQVVNVVIVFDIIEIVSANTVK